MIFLTTLVAFAIAQNDYENSAGFFTGLGNIDDEEGPQRSLVMANELKENDASLWEQQAQELAKNGHTVLGKKRVAAHELFESDDDFNAFLEQFHPESRKRSTKLMRYKKETLNGAVVETLANWNAPVQMGAVEEEKPSLTVGGQTISANVGKPSSESSISGLPLVDCKKMLTASDCGAALPAGGFVALVGRGDATFAAKLANCVAAGAKGMIIYNNNPLADEPLSAGFGDEKTPFPVLCLTRAQGESLVATGVGKPVDMTAPKGPTKSGVFMPLTARKDQGSCGDCYLFAAMTSVNMWANLLLWEAEETANRKFDGADQLWIDTLATTHCYQKVLDDLPNPEQASINLVFSGDTPHGTEDEVKEIMAKIISQLKFKASDATAALSSFAAWSIQEVEANECGWGCHAVNINASPYRTLMSRRPSDLTGNVVSNGFEATVGTTTYKITSATARLGAKVCGGGWHHKVLEQWYDNQQISRLSKANTAVPLWVAANQNDEREVSRLTFEAGPSQKKIDSAACKPIDVKQQQKELPILYRFDPQFDEDEAKINKPPREGGILKPYRPLYAPQSASPGSIEFADKVRSVASAAQFGPVMIGVAVCSTMFGVGASNSAANPYFDLNCKDNINHIVNVVGFHIEDLPAPGQGKSTVVGGKQWWERSSLLVQNTWGSWGVQGQAWVRVDFTQKWGLGIVPLIRRAGSFANPYLPSKRLTELRFLGATWSSRTETISSSAFPTIAVNTKLELSRPTLPEVALSAARVRLVVLAASDVTVAPTWKPSSVVFAALYAEQKYLADDVAQQALSDAMLTSSTSAAREMGNWVIWSAKVDASAQWTPTTITTRRDRASRAAFEMFINVPMALTKLSTVKPSSFWQRVTLQINGDAFVGSEQLVLGDFSMTVDQKASQQFRKDAEEVFVTPSGSTRASTTSVGVVACALASLLVVVASEN